MSIVVDNVQYCKVFRDGIQYCTGYINGVKVLGCEPESTRIAPTVSDNFAYLTSRAYTHKEEDFTKDFVAETGFTYNKTYLQSLTIADAHKLLGEEVSVGSNFKVINSNGLKYYLSDYYAAYNSILYKFDEKLENTIAAMEAQGYNLTSNVDGVLVFTNPEDSTTQTVEGTPASNSELEFTFKVSDNSEEQLLTNTALFSLIPQGDINVKPLYSNESPIIGDNVLYTDYDKSITFTREDFVENTHPVYFDAEGDEPWRLLVATLPQYGILTLEGVAVVVGQILTFEDISAGKFVYTPDASRTDINNDPFKFSVADVGSKEFAEWQ